MDKEKMPNSIPSLNRNLLSVSKRGHSYRYRTRNSHSEADPMLFTKDVKTYPNVLKGITGGYYDGNMKREKVRVITKDLIRDLIIPETDPMRNTAILEPIEYSRIIKNSRNIAEDSKMALEERLKKMEAKQQMCCERREVLKKSDTIRIKSEKLSDLETEAKRNVADLQTKVKENILEQEDDIKHFNELILNAKCNAIRDCQLEEKKLMANQLKLEEKLLDAMMEAERQVSINYQKDLETKQKQERLVGALKLREQITKKEEDKMLLLEVKDQEHVRQRKNFEQLIDDDERSLSKKRRQQLELREDLKRANENFREQKTMQKERDKLEEKTIMEFQKNKAEREAFFEAEQARIRKEREIEITKMLARQEKAIDKTSERQAIHAKRERERAERDWRRKEATEAKKKSELAAKLMESHRLQSQEKAHKMALQANRDRTDFENIIRHQREVMEMEKKEEDAAYARSLDVIREVQLQIRKNEQVRIEQRQAFFEEGRKIREEDHRHILKLKSMKEKKLNELRKTNIPERYLLYLENDLKLTEKNLDYMQRSIGNQLMKESVKNKIF